jgi:hemerythrin-like metal-binding protein
MGEKTRWDPKLSVGLDSIDNQHEMLFARIKDLRTSFALEVNMRVQNTLHGVLMNFALEHFHIEEECFKNHPDYTRHCLEHYRITYKLQKFIFDFRNTRNNEDPGNLGFFENWLEDHIQQFDRPFFAHDTVNLNAGNLNTVNLTLMTESERIDDFNLESIEKHKSERRKHRRIRHKEIIEEEIRVHCQNVTRNKNGQATIVNISTGGLMLMASNDIHQIDDLLIITCSIGSHFKMKEKVKVRRAINKIYGVEFVSLSLETMHFITGLYGSIHMGSKHRLI